MLFLHFSWRRHHFFLCRFLNNFFSMCCLCLFSIPLKNFYNPTYPLMTFFPKTEHPRVFFNFISIYFITKKIMQFPYYTPLSFMSSLTLWDKLHHSAAQYPDSEKPAVKSTKRTNCFGENRGIMRLKRREERICKAHAAFPRGM